MSDRRSFFKALGAAAGSAALADLAFARSVVASELQHVPQVSSAMDMRLLRDRYFLDPDVLYVNHASIGTIPRIVHEARTQYLRLCETNPWRYMWGGEWEEPREEVRVTAALMLGCLPEELAFTHNTTEGFNVLAQGLPLKPGDEVLFSTLNHPGASVCWHHFASTRGFSVRQFDFPMVDVPRLAPQDVVEIYAREITSRTRVLVFPHIDNIVGVRYPMRELANMARSRGVEFVAADGAQALGMIPLDVGSSGVDFYAASPHKWLQAPKGLGLLYVRSAVRDALRPLWVTWGQERWKGTVRTFEDYGTRNLPEVITLGDAMDFQKPRDPKQRDALPRAMADCERDGRPGA
jgi:selenocysteine lyase/cysteine desulfurase